MTLCDDINDSVIRGENMAAVEVNLVFRQITDDGEEYFVAECLEIPGCVSQGNTREEAEANIKDAIGACLNVMYSEALNRLMVRPITSDLRGISSQRRLKISQPQSELQYA
jgi:predicted RNase H-like HicB family nuclease